MSDGRDGAGRFAAGNPGGPGRGKKIRRIEHILGRIGEEEVTAQGVTMTKLEAVLRAVFGYALKGQSWAVQFIAERTEGKVREQMGVEITSPEPIKLFDVGAEQEAE
jgi:hypothetical protein